MKGFLLEDSPFKILHSDIYMQYEPDCEHNGEVDKFHRQNLRNKDSGMFIIDLEASSCAIANRFLAELVQNETR